MKMQEIRAIKRQLHQLDIDLRRFKRELLAARAEEFEQAIRSVAARSSSGRSELLVMSHCHSKFRVDEVEFEE